MARQSPTSIAKRRETRSDSRLPWPSFLLFNGLGSALWIGAGVGAGILLKAQIEALLAKLENFGSIAVMLIGAMLAAYIALKWWQRRRFFKTLRMARIGVDELYRLMGEGAQPVVVDVRTAVARQVEPRRDYIEKHAKK